MYGWAQCRSNCGFDNTTKNCGSGLARDSGVTVNLVVECYSAFASKPAPTGDECCQGYLLSVRAL
ncbi:hypothetical protein EYC95_07905 [Pseudomonas sp. BGI-2]|nr:hypothetical protein EYC95_07905 [Pseudomonas sp. BGI-2]